ncbi:MAG TPA: hypothetical protein VGG21_05005 [Acidimicrobiales bacterium]|jgi:hypothetical protein
MHTFRRLSVLSVAVLSGALVVVPSLSAQAAGAPSAKSLLAAAKTALAAENGVHIVVTTLEAKIKSSVVADIGNTSGTETYNSGTEKFTISVTPTVAYMSGSKKGLTTIMGLSSTQQQKVGTATVVMKKGTSPYTSLHSNLTANAYAQLLPTLAETKLLRTRDKSTHGYKLTWTTKATSTTPKSVTVMVVSSGAKALPISESVTSSSGTSRTTFTHWGEKVVVKKPAKTIAYSTVFG